MKQKTEKHLKVADLSSPVVTVPPDNNFVEAVQMKIIKGTKDFAVVGISTKDAAEIMFSHKGRGCS